MSHNIEQETLMRRIRIALMVVMGGLVISGISVYPILLEVDLLNQWFGAGSFLNEYAPEVANFFTHIHVGVNYTDQHYSFLFYGLDWLGFAHIVIALAFIGPLRDPVRNQWVIEWGVLVCALAVPSIFIFGFMRDMPFFWSVIDGMFPLFAVVPLALAWYWSSELSANAIAE